MATAYAAVVSLTQVINQVLTYHHTRQPTFVVEQLALIENLKEKVSCIQEFLEKYSHVDKSIPIQIEDAAHDAEDILECHIFYDVQYHYKSKEEKEEEEEEDELSLSEQLNEVIREMVKIEEKIRDILKETPENLQPHYAPESVDSSASIDSEVVGFDDYLVKVKDTLLGTQSYLILPITGMGGIGKSTLAKKVYDDRVIRSHFKYRGWITISQRFDLREMLLGLLRDFKVSFLENDDKDDELGNKLYKHLSGKRFLIVLDDLWSSDAFEKLKFYLRGGNRSRILVTTRLKVLAGKICTSSFQEVGELDVEKSWELLCRKAFSENKCPSELIDSGKEIAKNCKGLPLSLVVIAGHLAKSDKTEEVWRRVAEQTSKFVSLEDNERCRKTLSLSYTHLPIHLKPCILHMGSFSEDHMIHVSELVRLWVAEGFLKPENDKTLEEVARGHLIDLVDRNLVFARIFGSIGTIKVCQIHDIVRDFCLAEGVKERFFFNFLPDHDITQDLSSQQRIVIPHTLKNEGGLLFSITKSYLQSAILARSMSCNPECMGASSPLAFILMRVWNVSDQYQEPADIFKLINLRYLSVEYLTSSNSLSMLWNLQTLIASGESSLKLVSLPPEIWNFPHLRHMMVVLGNLPDIGDDTGSAKGGSTVLGNFQTLKCIGGFRCTEEALKRIPNVKTLKISLKPSRYKKFSIESCHLSNLAGFEKILSLTLSFGKGNNCSQNDFLHHVKFPASLKKLSLYQGIINWDDMRSKIGRLPNLEKLKVIRFVQGEEWNAVDGEFHRLKYLEIQDCYLVHWNANKCHFPCLKQLVLGYMDELVKIPSGIGEIDTLQRISVDHCTPSCNDSAVAILKERLERVGNKDLTLILDEEEVVLREENSEEEEDGDEEEDEE